MGSAEGRRPIKVNSQNVQAARAQAERRRRVEKGEWELVRKGVRDCRPVVLPPIESPEGLLKMIAAYQPHRGCGRTDVAAGAQEAAAPAGDEKEKGETYEDAKEPEAPGPPTKERYRGHKARVNTFNRAERIESLEEQGIKDPEQLEKLADMGRGKYREVREPIAAAKAAAETEKAEELSSGAKASSSAAGVDSLPADSPLQRDQEKRRKKSTSAKGAGSHLSSEEENTSLR